ncbi:MAG: FtsX-like permease family protein [Lachnospiraceae bacterium]|jgi:putative ABC transport system permease protein|nr:FtsX-like permease family protein [Lachnospiraceae bacterium]MCX4317311.1 FtsX-like permease family protein [Lachnospiraceae bacterium]
MWRFVLQKLIHKKWMVVSLFIGNVLLIAIACSNPMYSEASLQRMLTDDLGKYLEEKNVYPGRMMFSSELNGGSGSGQKRFLETEQTAKDAAKHMGVAELLQVEHRYLKRQKSISTLEKEEQRELTTLQIGYMSDLTEHIRIVSGECYKETEEDGTVQAIVSERAMVEMNFIIGEVIECPKLADKEGKPLRVRITGVFEHKESSDPYWVYTPSAYYNECFISEAEFERLFGGEQFGEYDLAADWFVLLDYTDMKSSEVTSYLEKTNAYTEEFGKTMSSSYRESFCGVLEEFLKKETKVRVTLLVLQVPVLVLLCSFIFMIAGQMLEMEQNEIAMLKSRGSGRGQILLVYLIQSVMVAGVSLLVGLPLGSFLCRALGSANAFLEFVQRRSLQVEINGTVLLYGLGAALVSVAAMVLPVIKHSRVTIVDYKRKRGRKSDKALWQRMFLDILLLAVALYGYYSFYQQQDITLKKVLSGESIDPLLFISSSLFIIGTALVSLRILPLFTRVVYRLFRRWWSPSAYASFLQIIRTGSRQRFIMVFLMLTVALGIFNAATARTILSNAEKNLRYSIGADVVLQEKWNSNEASVSSADEEIVYEEPDFSKYEELEGIEHVTKVLRQDRLSVQANGEKLTTVSLLGIHTKEFGETAWFDTSLYQTHPYDYLNAMAGNANAILVSANFKTLGYQLGDVIYYTGKDKQSAMGIIYGFVEYWPAWEKSTKTLNQDGTLSETTNYLIVAHLAQLQEEWGVQPYEVWIRTNGSSRFLYDFAQEQDLQIQKFRDTAAELVELKNDTVFQGTSGILTISFIVVLILCVAGFLIYWVLSIRSRELLFGIFRAMGMSMREILLMLVNEQIFISGLSIAMGAGIGVLASRLYIPLIQLAYSASDQSVPLAILIQSGDMIRLFVIVGLVLLLCMVVLGVLIRRINISQALKLGEES